MVFCASRRRGSLAGVKFVGETKDLAAIVRGLQCQGKVVVLVAGVFDLLHAGHIRCLRDAKSRGDYLVVAVQGDRAVRRYKDASLPVVPQRERVELLEALACVDYVTVFPHATAAPLLEQIRPNIYAVGRDRRQEEVPEAAAVRRYGGRLLVVGDGKGHSTRALLARIRELPGAPPPRRRPRGRRALEVEA